MNRSLPKGKHKKVIGAMKHELRGKIMKEFVGLRAKTYSYLTDNSSENEKVRNAKTCGMKTKLNLKILKTV